MFNFLFNPCGRVSRKGIWLGLFLPMVGANFAAAFVDAMIFGAMGGLTVDATGSLQAPATGVFSMLVSLFFLWPSIAVSVKRFHDRNMSGWWVLWFLLIVVGGVVFAFVGGAAAAASTGALGEGAMIGFLIAMAGGLAQFIILYVLPGTPGGNQYGSDPRGGSGVSRVSSDDGASSDWADRLADPARMSAAAGSAKKAAPAAAPAAARTARATSWPASAGPRTSFGRRGS